MERDPSLPFARQPCGGKEVNVAWSNMNDSPRCLCWDSDGKVLCIFHGGAQHCWASVVDTQLRLLSTHTLPDMKRYPTPRFSKPRL